MNQKGFTISNILLRAIFLLILASVYQILQAQVVPDNKRYLGLSLVNENDKPQLELIQKAKDTGLNSVLLSIQWGSIHGHISKILKQENGTNYNVWKQYDDQIAKARSLGMKVAINIAVSTGDPNSTSLSDRYGVTTGDGWAKEERMLCVSTNGNEAVYQISGGEIRPGVYLQFVMTSLAAQSTKNRITEFAREVTQRYKYLQNTNELLYMNLIWTRTGEGEFDSSTTKWDYNNPLDMEGSLTDYSQPMISAYKSWITNKYGNIGALNTKWGTSYSSLSQINPKRPTNATFTGEDGRDWYLFRTQVLKETNELFKDAVKSEDSRIKVIVHVGSMYDKMSPKRNTLSFDEIGSDLDGIKFNDAGDYDHRFALDLARTNLPGKIYVNESEYSSTGINPYLKLVTQSYEHGAQIVSLFQFEAAINAGHQEAIRNLTNSMVNNQLVTSLSPANNDSFTLSSMINSNGCFTTNSNDYSWDCDAYKNWNAAYINSGNRPVNIFIKNDLNTISTCPTITVASSNYSPTSGADINLSASCSGDCSGVSYTWSGNGISGNSASVNVTAPATSGNYTYTLTTTKSGCSSTTTNVEITVTSMPVTTACYTLKVASNGLMLTNFNGILKIKAADNSDSQKWKLESSGGYTKVIASDNRILGVENAGNSDGNLLTLQTTGTQDHLLWANTALTGASAGMNAFIRKGSTLRFGSTLNNGGGDASNGVTDIRLTSDPDNVYGSNKWIVSSATCPGSPVNVNCSNVQANIEHAGCDYISGWAYDQSNVGTPINFDLYEGNTLIQSNIPASNYRADLQDAFGNGYHAFSFTTPTELKNGQNHTFSLRASGCNTIIYNSERTISCNVNARIAGNANSIKAELTDSENAKGLIISPNPNAGDFEVTFYLENDKKVNLTILNVQGKSYYEKKVSGNGKHIEKISLKNVSSGTYLIQLRKQNYTEVKKMIIR